MLNFKRIVRYKYFLEHFLIPFLGFLRLGEIVRKVGTNELVS